MKKILNYFKKQKIKAKIKAKIKEAEFAKLTTGKRHYVLPVKEGDYMIVNSGFVDFYNKNAENNGRKVTIQDLIKESIYQTK